MNTEITLKQAVGKTLQGIEAPSTCGQMVMAFTDGTFTTLRVERGSVSGGEALELDGFVDEDLNRFGVTTYEDLNPIRSARDAESRAECQSQQDARDRAVLFLWKRK